MENLVPRRIGDVAKAAGVGVETVRFYEREGLIDRPVKPVRGWRDYGDGALAQLSQVRLAQAMGLTLRDMKQVKARARGPRPAFCAAVRETVAARLAAIEAEIAELQKRRAALRTWRRLCAAREGTPDCPLYAQLNSLLSDKPKRRR
jgi:MerR family mercuric resistance operon transcriptional regulator